MNKKLIALHRNMHSGYCWDLYRMRKTQSLIRFVGEERWNQEFLKRKIKSFTRRLRKRYRSTLNCNVIQMGSTTIYVPDSMNLKGKELLDNLGKQSLI